MDLLDRLTATEAIKALKARYFRCVDGKDWDGLTQVFAPDIAFDRTYGMSVRDPWTGVWTPSVLATPVVVHGRDAVMQMVRSAIENLRTVHQGFMPEIDVLSENNARGVWAMRDELYDKSGRLIVAGSGHYHETYELLATGWAISTSKLTRLRLTYGDGQRDA